MDGLESYLSSQFYDWLDSTFLAGLLSGLVITILWIGIAFLVGWILKVSVLGYFVKKKGDRRGKTLGRLVASTLKILVWFIVLLQILLIIGFDITPILASAGILGLAIGFGAQSLVKDVVSGFFIIVDNAFNLEETVEINGYRGTVVKMNLRITHLQHFTGSIYVVNNGNINQLINHSRNHSTALVDFGVAYETDLSKLASLMPDFMETLNNKHEDIVDVPSFLGVTDLADSSINLRIFAKTKTGQQWAVERKIRHDLVELLRENDIEIPFPQLVITNKNT